MPQLDNNALKYMVHRYSDLIALGGVTSQIFNTNEYFKELEIAISEITRILSGIAQKQKTQELESIQVEQEINFAQEKQHDQQPYQLAPENINQIKNNIEKYNVLIKNWNTTIAPYRNHMDTVTQNISQYIREKVSKKIATTFENLQKERATPVEAYAMLLLSQKKAKAEQEKSPKITDNKDTDNIDSKRALANAAMQTELMAFFAVQKETKQSIQVVQNFLKNEGIVAEISKNFSGESTEKVYETFSENVQKLVTTREELETAHKQSQMDLLEVQSLSKVPSAIPPRP